MSSRSMWGLSILVRGSSPPRHTAARAACHSSRLRMARRAKPTGTSPQTNASSTKLRAVLAALHSPPPPARSWRSILSHRSSWTTSCSTSGPKAKSRPCSPCAAIMAQQHISSSTNASVTSVDQHMPVARNSRGSRGGLGVRRKISRCFLHWEPATVGGFLLRRKTRRAHASDFTHWRNLAPSIRNSPEQVWKGEEFRISDGRPPQSLFGAMLSLYSAVSGFASTPQGQFGCYCAPPAPILPHNMTCTRALLLLSSPHAISPPIGFGPMTAKDAASFQRSCCRWQLPPVLGPPHPRWVSRDVLRRATHCSHGQRWHALDGDRLNCMPCSVLRCIG